MRFRMNVRKALRCWKPGFYEPSGASSAPPIQHACGVGVHLQYTGLLCGLCAEAHYRSGPHKCSPCSSSSVQVTAPHSRSPLHGYNTPGSGRPPCASHAMSARYGDVSSNAVQGFVFVGALLLLALGGLLVHV